MSCMKYGGITPKRVVSCQDNIAIARRISQIVHGYVIHPPIISHIFKTY